VVLPVLLPLVMMLSGALLFSVWVLALVPHQLVFDV
jgi:hypothetical protein